MATIQNEDVLNFSCSLSLRSGCSASMRVVRSKADAAVDPNDWLGQIYSLYVKQDSVDYLVFVGVVDDISVSVDTDSNIFYDVGLVSQTASLATKPINTETYGLDEVVSVTGEDILNDIFITYGSIDASLVNTSRAATTDDSFRFVTIMGDSCIEEAKKIAQASVVGNEPLYLYTREDGVLDVQKFGLNPVPYSISSSKIMSVSKQVTKMDGFSKVRVRGRYQSLDESGPSTWYNQSFNINNNEVAPSFYKVINVKGDVTEIRATKWTSTTPLVSVRMVSANTNGTAKFRFFNSNGFPSGPTTINLSGYGPRAWSNEKDSMSLQTISNMKSGALNASRAMVESQGGRNSFVNWAWSSQKESDASEESRIDIVGVDSSLLSELGVRFTTIDNPYIPHVDTATSIGTDFFTQFKRSKEVWQVRMIYDSDVTINKLVTFPDPISGATKIAVVTNSEISYDPQTANAEQNITLELKTP